MADTLLSTLTGGGVGTSDEKRLTALRQCAEALAQNYLSEDSLNDNTLSPAQAIETLHELRVHKIELEMQIEELSRTQSELDISRTRYMDFYDLAPVGYCTLSSKGLISEVNLTTTTTLLNVPRSQLIKQPISRFILKEDHTTYYQFRHEVRNTHKSLSCELRLLKREGAPFWVHLLATAVQDDDGGFELRMVLTDITERKKVEAALRESEERYRSLVEWTPEPVVVHGAGKTLYVNPAAMKMFGATSASDLVGKPTLDLIHPDFRKTVTERLKVNVEPGGSTPVLEQKLLKLDGSVIDVEVQGIQINFNGKPAIQAAMHDVTQRKAAEQALSESEFRWRFAVEGTGDGLWDWDVAQSTVLFSRRWKEMLGFSQGEIGNGLDEWSKRVHPDDLARVMVDVQAHLDGATADYVNEHRVSGKDGSWKWILDRGLVVNRDPAGTPLRLIGTHTDITERRNAEAKLQLAANVFNHAREGVTITDADGSIIDVNAAFTRITGYSREEVIGQNLRILQSGRQTKEFYVAMWGDLLASGHWSGEIWNKRKNGEIYPQLLTVSAVTDAQGGVSQYVGLFTDITVRRQMEDKVHQMAFFDPLTKLPNRRTLSDRLGQTMASSKRSGRYGALMVLDLDNFKPLNDTHGHGAGDLLLEVVAGRMMACVREVDTVSRIGGDEFVVLLSELDTDRSESISQAGLIAEKIRLALAAPYSLPLTRQGQEAAAVEHLCSVSIGVVLLSNHEASQEDILRWADAAMYQAKSAGRNAIRFHGVDGLT